MTRKNRGGGRPYTDDDPPVVIDGRAIHAKFPLMPPRRLSINRAAKMLREMGIQLSGPALNDIVLGRTRITRKSVADGLARICEMTGLTDDV